MSDKQKKEAQDIWKIEGPKRDACRTKRGYTYVQPADTEAYEKALKDAERMVPKKAPCMPLKQTQIAHSGKAGVNTTACQEGETDNVDPNGSHVSNTTHNENTSSRGFSSDEQFAMVHAPIPIEKALQIPAAKKAMDKEWDKLDALNSFNYASVQEKWVVQGWCKSDCEIRHFANVMPICHKKNAQLTEKHWVYKGRVVLRGDQIKDEDGYWAVFSEQGTSASSIASMKFLNAIAMAPGNDGENSDAKGAYTQIILGDDIP